MVRFVFRLLAYFALAVAVMFAVIDATRSIGISNFVFTPFGESFEMTAPQMLAGLQAWLADNAPAFVSADVLATLLQIPTFAVFAALSVLLYAIGRHPERRQLRTYAR